MKRETMPGYYTAQEALHTLQITEGVLYSLVRQGVLKRHTPPGKKYGVYRQEEVDLLAQERTAFMLAGLEVSHQLTFAQATPYDMEGVYLVARQLFGEHTTSADQRAAAVAKEPRGNYVVKDHGRVVAWMHVQPLRTDRLAAFMRGEIRGWQITGDDIEPFAPGRPIECLLKSMGAYHPVRAVRAMYTQRLFSGAARAMAELGERGIQIAKIYATSETETGIATALHAKMQPLGRIPGTKDKRRYAFCLDVATSDLPLLQPYKAAFSEWLVNHRATQQKHAVARSLAPQRASFASGDTLPDGFVSAMAFAGEHGIHEGTARKAIASGRLPAIQGKWKLGRAYVVNALDASGRARFYELYSENEHFTPCPECPHT